MEFTAAQDGLRVDVFLAGCLPELTRSAVQRLLAEGGARLISRASARYLM